MKCILYTLKTCVVERASYEATGVLPPPLLVSPLSSALWSPHPPPLLSPLPLSPLFLFLFFGVSTAPVLAIVRRPVAFVEVSLA